MRPGAAIEAIFSTIQDPSQRQQILLDRLGRYADRLNSSQFQLAVLGQFKRGKSTLLNALVGRSLLAMDVLPITAIPTFLTKSQSMKMDLIYRSGAIEHKEISDFEALVRELAAMTTEEGNPRNMRGLDRVEVSIPWRSPLDVTLIDTPGIGSTYTHNTKAAEAILPECDAALFVVSVDPPITEAELSYLSTISKTVSHIIIVMNKVDLLERSDLERALSFLSSVVHERGRAHVDSRIFTLSARAAFRARLSGDDRQLGESGLIELEEYVSTYLAKRKQIYLERTIAQNVAVIIDELQLDADLTRRALMLPMSELDEKISVFEDAVDGLARERDTLQDLITGEWTRTLAGLDSSCNEVEARVRRQLLEMIEKSTDSLGSDANQKVFEDLMGQLFDREFGVVVSEIHARMAAAMEAHKRQYSELVRRVREIAATLVGASAPLGMIEDTFTAARDPYWVSRGLDESFSSLTVDGLSRLLPKSIQRRRRQQKFRRAIEAAISRNISSLHWAMRQNIDDAFRRLIFIAKESVETSISATRDLLTLARARKELQDASIHGDIDNLGTLLEKLAATQRELAKSLDVDELAS